jgi:hypothetical protein
MKRIFVPLVLLLLCGTDDCDSHNETKKVPPVSMRVVEYSEITGSMPGPAVHVWMVADDKRDLCFAVFQSGNAGIVVVRVDCEGIKPTPERGCPFPKPFGFP